MPRDIGRAFRQAGQDIREAIVSGPRARLQADELRRNLDERDFVKSERARAAEERDKSKQKLGLYAEAMGKEFGPSVKAAIEAGASPSDIAALRKLRRKKEYGQDFEMSLVALQKSEKAIKESWKNVGAAQASGDKAAVAKAMEDHNARQDALERVQARVASMDKTVGSSYVALLTERAEQSLLNLHPDKFDALEQTILGSLGKYTKIGDEMIHEMENANNEYGVGIDLSGIPSLKTVKMYVGAAIAQGDLTEGQAEMILNERDPEDLEEFVNNKDMPEAARKLAGMVLKQWVAYDSIDPLIRAKMSALTNEELGERSLQNVLSKGSGIAFDVLRDRNQKSISNQKDQRVVSRDSIFQRDLVGR